MSLIVRKECNICFHVEAPDCGDKLFCKLNNHVVEDTHICDDFKVCSEVFSDTFFNIQEIKDYDL